ncbi:hypothetical protein ACIPPM_06295 [Streptomyces sp. NPDC090119]|uniref:hypothetical protein n=1 Tax=Streptomyces sp. NPDC090119 TaxID=3365951 RepID=UPI0037F3CE96
MASAPGARAADVCHEGREPRRAQVCGGRQAFLLLPDGARAPEDVLVDNAVAPRSDVGHAAAVQFLCSRRIQDGGSEVFEAGRLAVRWFEQQVGPETHQLMTS